jgi:hypothetical protein
MACKGTKAPRPGFHLVCLSRTRYRNVHVDFSPAGEPIGTVAPETWRSPNGMFAKRIDFPALISSAYKPSGTVP